MKKCLRFNLVVLLYVLVLTFQPLSLYSQEPSFQERDISRFSTIARTYDKAEAYSFVNELTKDEYEGRSAGSPGCDKAGDWIASQFKSWNLHPYSGDSYLQPINNALFLSKSNNVIGYIPSIDPKSTASIIIGAHYDHIGKNPAGAIYHGANDNASGTGVMMEFARTLSSSIVISHINIIFIAFSAEEKGLFGSYYYVKNPLFPIKDVVAMINLDMVGTGIGPWEIATNFEKDKNLNQILTKSFIYYKVSFRLAPGYLRPVSDHFAFYEKGIPVVFFIRSNPSNIGGYHTLKDTIDTIDPKNLEECGKLAILIVLLVSKDKLVIYPRFSLVGDGSVHLEFYDRLTKCPMLDTRSFRRSDLWFCSLLSTNLN